MRRWYSGVVKIVGFIAAFVAFVATAAAQETASLPPGVTWLSRPDPQDLGKPAGERFVIFVREPTGEGEWDFVASMWELVPGPSARVTPRVRFEHSMWSPRRLISGERTPHDELVRLQFGGAGSSYTTKLFGIDYCTWKVRTLWEGPQCVCVFSEGDNVYLDVAGLRPSADGLRVLRCAAGVIELPRISFRDVRPIPGPSHHRLVQLKGAATDQFEVFDASSEKMLGAWTLPEGVESDYSELAFSDDLSMCAMHLETDVSDSIDFMKIGQWQYASSKIRILARGAGGPPKEVEVPIGLYAAPGSGIKFALSGPGLRFTKEGRVRYVSSPRPVSDEKAIDWRRPRSELGGVLYDYDPGSGVTTKAPEEATATVHSGSEAEVPDDLLQFVDPAWPREHALAYAFLKSKGVKFDASNVWSDAVTAYSTDRKRFLLKLFHGGHEESFFLGDLEKGTLVEVPSPKSLQWANDMSILYVPTR